MLESLHCLATLPSFCNKENQAVTIVLSGNLIFFSFVYSYICGKRHWFSIYTSVTELPFKEETYFNKISIKKEY
jgi:hypothetical protein